MQMKTSEDLVRFQQGRAKDTAMTERNLIMNTVVTTSDHTPKQALLQGTPAANDDGVGGDAQKFQSTGSAWDSYEVWRRFIKEARERRERNPS
jgi:hypothetical protein